MPRLHLPRTETTPEVLFDMDAGRLRLEGCFAPENAESFFRPLIEQVERYARGPAARTVVSIFLDYFNSSSSKYLLELLRLLDEVHASGAGAVELEWHYAEDDMDMEEAGRDYGALLEMPVRMVSVPDR